MIKDDITKYWIDSSDMDFKAMESLFNSGHYVWSLFVGHLVIEKLLKAYYAKTIGVNVPPIHNLLKIAEMARLELSYEQRVFLDEVTTFNIRARYPDYKRGFYKKATKEFAEKYLKAIKDFRLWLTGKINS
jgi:HEPN domain-containing protein